VGSPAKRDAIWVSLLAADLFPVRGAFMSTTGELIRLMNYVDDIATTLRRISATLPSMTDEERKRLAEYMRKSDPLYETVLAQLDKGAK
jgi:hypothetical protein